MRANSSLVKRFFSVVDELFDVFIGVTHQCEIRVLNGYHFAGNKIK